MGTVRVRKDIIKSSSNDNAESIPIHEEARRKRPSGSAPEKVKKKKQKLPEAGEMSPSKEAKRSNPASSSTSTASTSTRDTVYQSDPELEIGSECTVKRINQYVVTYGPLLMGVVKDKPINEALEESGNARPKGYTWPIKCQLPQPTNKSNIEWLRGNLKETQSLPKKTFPKAEAKLSKSNPPAGTSSKARESTAKDDGEPSFENVSQLKEILLCVIKNVHYKQLINNGEDYIISKFFRVTERAKALLLQLLETKHMWRRVSDMKYPEISLALRNEINELIYSGFLKKDTELTDLRETLHLLKGKEVEGLLDMLNLNKAKKKADNIELLLKYCQRQSSIGADIIRNARSRLSLGECVKVIVATADVLTRLSILESLPLCFKDASLSDILSRASSLERGALVYPHYKINLQTYIFNDRVSFLEFHKAYLLFMEMKTERVANNHSAVAELAKKALNAFKALFEPNKKAARAFDKALPEYLRRFSAGHTLALAMTRGLDALVKLKEFGCVLVMVETLLAQDLYCSKHRGCWYQSKANVCFKEMMRQEVFETIFKGINDAKVDMNAKVALASRAASFQTARLLSQQMKEKLEAYASSVQLSDPPCIVIKGERAEAAGGQAMDLLAGESLESIALNHYMKNEGYAIGLHNRGSMIVTLFAILFWDEIYDDSVADVFISKYQSAPLDLYGKEFYEKRQAQLERKMKRIEKWSCEESKAHFARTWQMSEDKECLVDTEAFANAAEAHGLFECIGAQAANKIFLKLMKDYGRSRGGFPNLVVWTPGRRNQNKSCYKFVTVIKNPDSLSTKQRLWNDFLMSIGINVEVCKVNYEKSEN